MGKKRYPITKAPLFDRPSVIVSQEVCSLAVYICKDVATKITYTQNKYYISMVINFD